MFQSKRNPEPLSRCPCSLPSSDHSTFCRGGFACSGHFDAHGIIQYVTSCVWRLILDVFKVYVCGHVRQYFILFYGRVIFHQMDHMLFIHSSSDGGLGSLHFLAMLSDSAVNICTRFYVDTFSIFLDT